MIITAAHASRRSHNSSPEHALAALLAAASWIFGLNELHQVVVAVILAAAAVVTAIVIATQVAVSFMLFDFTEDIEKEDDDA